MREEQIYDRLNGVFRDVFDDETITVDAETTANDIDDWDSLEHIRLIAAVEDEFGDIWNTYHARPGIDGPRSSGIRRVHIGFDGEPVLDLLEENELPKGMERVEVKIKG